MGKAATRPELAHGHSQHSSLFLWSSLAGHCLKSPFLCPCQRQPHHHIRLPFFPSLFGGLDPGTLAALTSPAAANDLLPLPPLAVYTRISASQTHPLTVHAYTRHQPSSITRDKVSFRILLRAGDVDGELGMLSSPQRPASTQGHCR